MGKVLLIISKKRQSEYLMFFYSMQVDDNRMENFFWRDDRSKLDNDSFGDVVIFGTTYWTNKYNLICASFVGINYHWNNILFSCVNEIIELFIWLF